MEWKNTAIWEELRHRNSAESVKTVLQVWMPSIETVLTSAGTIPLDFTLHDSGHAFRVAQRMAELMGSENIRRVSDIELALMLLASYLHDIGMSPTRLKSQNHLNYIMTADKNLLSTSEIHELRKWMDKERPNSEIPVLATNINQDGLKLAEDIHSYYVRHKHNDWSEDWIRENLEESSLSLYPNSIDDIVTVCRSHHEGLAELRKSRFDARIIGNPSQTVNIRWICAILRLADVIEFDPERTPDVILTHRSILPKSRIFWHKDKSIDFNTDASAGKLILTARTPNAVVHKAVLATADWVDDELATCSTLNNEGAFKTGTVPEADRGKYNWLWPARLTRDVREKDASFYYIDGAFRPETSKILKLLSGTALYGDKLAALRELVQNAVDAVREQIAYERLQDDNPRDSSLEPTLQSLHRIRITLSKIDDRYWLTCIDDGIGMDKQTIEKQLLVSGSDTRAEVKSLERDALSNGFSVNRTGQFGIGILSYFMIADRMEISTRRSLEAGDTDHSGWSFITEGIGSFGELTPVSRGSKGTEIKLRLTQDFAGDDAEQLTQRIESYFKETLRRLPCKFEFRDEIVNKKLILSSPGWTARIESLTNQVINGFKDLPSVNSIMTTEELEKRSALETDWATLSKSVESDIRWFGPFDHVLKNGSGHVRVWIPYFEIQSNPSLCYLRMEEERLIDLPNGKSAFLPKPLTIYSWRGFRIHGRRRSRNFGFLEFDLSNGADLEVNRAHMQILEDTIDEAEIDDYIRDATIRFLDTYPDTKFNSLNISIATSRVGIRGRNLPHLQKHWSSFAHESGQGEWRNVSAPMAEVYRQEYFDRRVDLHLIKDGALIDNLRSISIHSSNISSAICSTICARGRLIAHEPEENWYDADFGILWDNQSVNREQLLCNTFLMADFPKEWDKLGAILSPVIGIYNPNHEVMQFLSATETTPAGFNRDHGQALRDACNSRERALWFLLSKTHYGAQYWNALRDNYPDLFDQFWKVISPISRWNYLIDSNVAFSYDGISVSKSGAVRSAKALKHRKIKIDPMIDLEIPETIIINSKVIQKRELL